ncbi:MAG: CoA transferase [Chloroflexi bacterium]|nr:CoA transferase [Chloroflexota bacterium]
MANALDGIRVIDLTVWFQGPVAAQHLADFGAEVIHIERPQGGDLARGVRTIKAVPVGDWNQYFLVINRNKKSMAVDLKEPAGREILHRLVRESDVFLANVADDNLAQWQLTYEELREINPRLIYAIASGYGRYGEVTKPSFDMTVQALTGIMTRLGEPGQPPIYAGMGSGDAIGGLMCALGILLALYHRKQTGKGQQVNASLYGAQLFMAAPTLQAYLATESEQFSRQQSRKDAPNPLWNRYQAKDKWLFLCMANDDANWSRLCESLDGPELAADSRFSTAAGRERHAAELIELLDGALRQRTAEEWMERWQRLDIVAGPINNLADLAQDPQAWENDYFVETYCEEVQRDVTVRGLPIGLSKTPASVRSLGPELGQHTEEILVDTLGYSWDQVGELKSQGVIL